MEAHNPEARASKVVADSGKVIIDGPDGVAVTMSPDAAEETARRLLAAVGEARRQVDHWGSRTG